jgi:flagellar basal-body rod protein FlgF
MIRGLYTSAWGMMANNKMMDVISNNLANVNTNAYKKDSVILESFPSLLTKRINDTSDKSATPPDIGTMQLGSDVGEVFTYYNQGQMVQTNNNLDLSIQNSDSAFFAVSVPDANGNASTYYTRDGSFSLNADKQLVTKDGYLVLGENGPITLNGTDFKVESDGSIIQNGKKISKLLISQFQDTSILRKSGNNLVTAANTTGIQKFTGKVGQGCLEQSNVNIVKEMVDMITVMRSYEANQKILQTEDSTLDKAVNEVGSLR